MNNYESGDYIYIPDVMEELSQCVGLWEGYAELCEWVGDQSAKVSYMNCIRDIRRYIKQLGIEDDGDN